MTAVVALPSIEGMNRNDLAVLPIQHAVANASPSAWLDGIVVDDACMMMLDGDVVLLDAAVELPVGEPVAFHPVAEILALAGERHRARRAATA